MNRTILYVGNQLLERGANPTTIDRLAPLLAKEHQYTLITASKKKHPFFRLLEMVMVFLSVVKKTDYLLIDTYSTKAFWFALICSKLSRKFHLRYIPILHGGDLPKRYRKHPKTVTSFLKHAYQIVTPSEYLRDFFISESIESIKVIPNPLILERYRFRRRIKFYPKIIWVRAFDNIYNPILAVESFRRIVRVFPESSLTMVGPDKDGSFIRCKKLAERYSLNVNFTGKVSSSQLIDLLDKHSIFLNTSNYDNLPMSVIEAMAMRLIVVSTNVGGIPFLIKHNQNGLLLDQKTVESVFDSVIYIVENQDEIQSMIVNAHQTISQMDWNYSLKKWQEILT